MVASLPWKVRARRRLGAAMIDGTFLALSRGARFLPAARLERYGVERTRGIAYRATGRHEHTLDVYRPNGERANLPVVMYVHGGGFRAMSADSHWIMGLAFARRGFLVFNVDYRLAPRYPFPAALEDVCAAYLWVVRKAATFGGDASRVAIAGESAGANLVTALAIAACFRRPEPHARQVFEADAVPRAVLPAAGLLQVSDPWRFRRRRKIPALLAEQIATCSDGYLPRDPDRLVGGADLADPLRILEGDRRPERPLPPFHAIVGTRDPLLDDTRRLKRALDRRGVPCEARIFHGELHAFHALVWRPAARDAWRGMFRFVDSSFLDSPRFEVMLGGMGRQQAGDGGYGDPGKDSHAAKR